MATRDPQPATPDALRRVVSRGPDHTRRIAGQLAAALPRRAVIALHGELGSGKTCFVQGIAAALGIRGPVTSPSFTLINEYRGLRPLTHVDLYRLTGPGEAAGIGLEEHLGADGLTVIEWAERAAGLLPDDTVHVYLAPLPHPSHRAITIRCQPAKQVL